MKFVLLDEGGEISGYEVYDLPWEDMTTEEQEKTLQAWIPDREVVH